jgi:hypothetical protein
MNLFIFLIRNENFLLIFRESISSCEARKAASDSEVEQL